MAKTITTQIKLANGDLANLPTKASGDAGELMVTNDTLQGHFVQGDGSVWSIANQGSNDVLSSFTIYDGLSNTNTTDAVPALTSNTSGGGLAFWDSATTWYSAIGEPYVAFDGDLTNSSRVQSNTFDHNGGTFLGYIFPEAKLINKVNLIADDPGQQVNMVEDFRIEGSLDTTTGEDGTWVELGNYTGEVSWAAGESRTFTFSTGTKYIGFRIVILKSNGGNVDVFINEIEFIEDPRSVAIPTDTIIHYSFDSDTISGSTVSDLSGNGNDGTTVNATYSSGYMNEDINCIGSTTGSISNTLDLSTFTLSTFMKISGGTSGYLFHRPSNFYINFQPGLSRFEIQNYNGTHLVYIAFTYTVDQYYHVSATLTGTTVELFVDGVSIGSGSVVTTPDMSTTTGQIFGGGSVSYFSMDNFRIYNRALGQSEITALSQES